MLSLKNIRENPQSLKSIIRPNILKLAHDELVKEYIETYESKNNHKPSSDDIDYFIKTMIASGNAKRMADEILDEAFEKLFKKANKSLFSAMISDTTYSILSITLAVVYLILFVNDVCGEEFVKKSVLLNLPGAIASFYFIVITFIIYSKKDD